MNRWWREADKSGQTTYLLFFYGKQWTPEIIRRFAGGRPLGDFDVTKIRVEED